MIVARSATATFSGWERQDILGVAALAGAADLGRVCMAFSTRNGWISVLPLIVTYIDLLWFKAH